ncbi:MAG: type II toxin-antitoxin system HicA family toxin [Bacteroidales bacterium]|nr:type II toxin-antitoxin system HicA family toxin [Bacteroidales bacterium]
MKISELHKLIAGAGWVLIPKRGKGSHRRYQKNGKIYTVPFHKGKEIDNRFARKILKDLGIE